MTCHNKVYVSHLSDNGEVKKVIKLENYDFLTMRRQIEKKFALGDEEYEFRATIEPNGPYIQIDETDDDIIEEALDVKVAVRYYRQQFQQGHGHQTALLASEGHKEQR